ncbi:hypothetical protein BD309DRAFT_985103 [Dichomitus squalens]|nr:hypothetical protein BD309DRAFT_985103 [Dichomitus squalens]
MAVQNARFAIRRADFSEMAQILIEERLPRSTLDLEWTVCAQRRLQQGFERLATELFEDALLCATNARRKTVRPDDIALVENIRSWTWDKKEMVDRVVMKGSCATHRRHKNFKDRNGFLVNRLRNRVLHLKPIDEERRREERTVKRAARSARKAAGVE